MSFIQLIGIGLSGAVAAVMLRNYRPEMAVCMALATGVLILSYIIGMFREIVYMLEKIVDVSSLDKEYFYVILKIIGISYITEIASEICTDAGERAIASKIEIVGKLFILMVSIPVISGFLEVCMSAIRLI